MNISIGEKIRLLAGDEFWAGVNSVFSAYDGELTIKYSSRIGNSKRRRRKAVGYAYRPLDKNKNKYTVTVWPEYINKRGTLLHELAHILTYVKDGVQVKGHGKEFYQNFKTLFNLLGKLLFDECEFTVTNTCFSLNNNYKFFNLCLSASDCNDLKDNNKRFLFELSAGDEFGYKNKNYKLYKKDPMYYLCKRKNGFGYVKINRFIKVDVYE